VCSSYTFCTHALSTVPFKVNISSFSRSTLFFQAIDCTLAREDSENFEGPLTLRVHPDLFVVGVEDCSVLGSTLSAFTKVLQHVHKSSTHSDPPISFRNSTRFRVDITRVKVARNTTRYVDQASGLASCLHDERTGNKIFPEICGYS
jgi:hypothetical protein